MKPEQKNVIIASGDQVAIDAVAAKLMGFNPMDIQYINLAHNAGLGVGDPAEIEIVGADITNESWDFKVGATLHSFMGYLAWFGPTKVLQKAIFHTPLVHATNLFSEAFHDYYHWPLKEKKIYEQWLKDSPWGNLFQKYIDEGAQLPSTAPAVTA
jgi:hypothetical protein